MGAAVGAGVFTRVLCGVDATRSGLVPANLASRVAAPDGELELVSVEDEAADIRADAGVPVAAAATAASAVRATRPGLRLLAGNAIDALLAEIRRRRATLAVVGTHEHLRAVGIARGSVATHVLHEAPCSVLVAREPRAAAWPRSIVVGVDGRLRRSRPSAVARCVADRFGAAVRFVYASADPHRQLENARLFVPELEIVGGRALDALHVLSEDADLIIVGSRGLGGIRTLGSVSERVAHEARSSVLVVRIRGYSGVSSSPSSIA